MERLRTRSPAHPGAIVQRLYLPPLECSQEQVAQALGLSVAQFSQFLEGRLHIDPQLARALSKQFQTSQKLWVNLQDAWDAYQSGKPYCQDCRSVGIIHCHEPEYCGGMVYPPETPRTETTRETPMTEAQQEIDSPIDSEVPQEDFDDILFRLLADWNTRALVLEIPGLYPLVAEYFRDLVKAQWQQQSVIQPESWPDVVEESQDDPEDHEWCCAVCDGELRHGHCALHPYARVYDAMVD